MINKAERKEECERALYESFMKLAEENGEVIASEQRNNNIETMMKIFELLYD